MTMAEAHEHVNGGFVTRAERLPKGVFVVCFLCLGRVVPPTYTARAIPRGRLL